MATQTAERPIAQANEAALQALPFADAQDFEDARRGFLGTIDPMRIEAADGRVVWDMDAYAFVDGDPPADGASEPLASGAAAGDPRPVRGRSRHLPGPRLRPVEHAPDRGREGRDRRRPADLDRDGRRRAGALPQASRRPARHGAAVQPQPRRPLRRRPRDPRRRRARGGRAGDRAVGLPRARGGRERLRRHGDGAPRRVHVRRAARARTPRASSRPASGRRRRPAR